MIEVTKKSARRSIMTNHDTNATCVAHLPCPCCSPTIEMVHVRSSILQGITRVHIVKPTCFPRSTTTDNRRGVRMKTPHSARLDHTTRSTHASNVVHPPTTNTTVTTTQYSTSVSHNYFMFCFFKYSFFYSTVSCEYGTCITLFNQKIYFFLETAFFLVVFFLAFFLAFFFGFLAFFFLTLFFFLTAFFLFWLLFLWGSLLDNLVLAAVLGEITFGNTTFECGVDEAPLLWVSTKSFLDGGEGGSTTCLEGGNGTGDSFFP